jgi:hypothetical protein
MPDTAPDWATLEAAIRDAARDILADFDREKVAPSVALAICGIVVSRLLDHAPHYRAEFIAALQDEPDA